MTTTPVTWLGGPGALTSSACSSPSVFWSRRQHNGGPMNGRDFLAVAREVIRGATEAHWRTTAGRAYYSLMLVLRDTFVQWGLSAPSRAGVHEIILRRVYTSKDRDMKQIGQWLHRLRDLRVTGDYETDARPEFLSDVEAQRMVQTAQKALALFDAINADVPRRDAIATEIKAVFP